MHEGKAVILCKQYFGAITGGKFARIIRIEFDGAFAARCSPDDKVFLQDICPRQSSACAWRNIKAQQFSVFSLES